ncbi:MAG: nuclear transport factor 2 family protein [Rhizomicrobium sp.]|jgi:ketosteroid isomerase-like protein
MSSRNKRRLAIGIFAASLIVSYQAEAALSPPELSSVWAADWSTKNLDAVMQLYAQNPVFLPTVGASWDGTAAIRKNCAGVQAKFNPHIALHSIWSEASGDLAYDSGTYEETLVPVSNGKPIHAKGNYIFIFQRRANGPWKILEQTFTELEPIPL